MLEVRHLVRRFGAVTAVEDMSLTVRRGEVVGFVGANGSGKTTTMRIIMGVLAPHGGEVLWDSRSVDAAVRRRLGYLPEERGLYPKQAVADQLVYLGRLAGSSRSQARQTAARLLEELGIEEYARSPLESLSLGNQQRVQVAAASMSRPVALVLDEPFSGLDPQAVDQMAQMLRRDADRGVPVLFSSHQLDLVERLCDRVVVVDQGRVVAEGTPGQLRGEQDPVVLIRLEGDAGWLRDEPGIEVRDIEGRQAVVRLGSWTTTDLLRAALSRGGVHELRPWQPSLAEIFREVVSDASGTEDV
ncbi:ATP-binding cassette domain-containing protein [Actinomyces sp. 2119]|uniref:ABC transporter ATP-binding protein n=1 Tax=Actinomyces sp. 2119 TaxID=2321393 RepID=UPI000E6CA483|nr:ATP-binding cassette domain-containing protein [Actinomyces sp. 2119]RJF42453.1 ATP-binding cassette domain-containing protein [Actinomyces sp. 2119]